ncbi:MAG: pilus assembly protein [Planctomycetes bacterium]|nr:pilus assembly protein [Planctomycetota bacterium]
MKPRQQQPNQSTAREIRSVLRALKLQGACRSRRNRRGGSVTLEFILAFPILFIATLAIFEFGILLLVEQAVVTAAIEGSREGAKLGSTTDCVAKKVQSILGVHCIEFDTMTAQPNSGEARVIVEDGSGMISGERGNLSISCTPEGPVTLIDANPRDRLRSRDRCGRMSARAGLALLLRIFSAKQGVSSQFGGQSRMTRAAR